MFVNNTTQNHKKEEGAGSAPVLTAPFPTLQRSVPSFPSFAQGTSNFHEKEVILSEA